MAKGIGIDLGTTNSVAAFVNNGKPTIIPNAEGGRLTSSTYDVLLDEEGNIVKFDRGDLRTRSEATKYEEE